MTNVKIYQINMERDRNKAAFLSLEHLPASIDFGSYDKVFEGEVELGDTDVLSLNDKLEKIFYIFNCRKPKNYKGRSLSVSDVVELDSKFYFCDNIGFKAIDFEPNETGEGKRKIKVVLCKPGEPAVEVEIGASLRDFQNAVDGNIETYYPFEEAVAIVCNEEGKFNGCKPCRAVYGKSGEMLDIIFGTFFICSCGDSDLSSLSEEQLSRYKNLFRAPEHFYRENGQIHVVKKQTTFTIRHEEKLVGFYDVEASSSDEAMEKWEQLVSKGEIDFSDMDLIDSEDTVQGEGSSCQETQSTDYVVLMRCHDAECAAPYWDKISRRFTSLEEAREAAEKAAEDEASSLNDGCRANRSFGTVTFEPSEQYKPGCLRPFVSVHCYLTDGETDATGETFAVTEYFIV